MRRAVVPLVAAALVLVNVAALWFLQRHLTTPPPTAERVSVTPSPSATEDLTEAATDGLRAPLWLAADAAGNVLRVTVGSCSEERATAWFAAGPDRAPEVIEIPGLSRLLALARTSQGWLVVGADEDCEATAWTAAPAAQEWTRTEPPEDVSRLQADDLAEVVTPRGPVILPCLPTQLASSRDATYAVCAEQVLSITGARVNAVSAPAGTVAMAVRSTPSGTELAFLGTEGGCPAQVTVPRPNGKAATACLARDQAGIGLAWAGEDLVAQVGRELMVRSPDGEWTLR